MSLLAQMNPIRLYQRWRLRGTRLRAVLARRHVDVGLYLDTITPAQFREQLAHCRGCEHTRACDRTAASLAAGWSKYAFCPNAAVIERFADTEGIRPTLRALI